jgi:heme exporter protein B
MKVLRQTLFLSIHQLRYEFRQRERLLSLILLAFNLLLMNWFASGESDPDQVHTVVVAQIFTTAFIAMQLAFVRIFEPEEEDRAFDLMTASPVSYSAWFLSKVLSANLIGSFVVFPVVILSAIVHHQASDALVSFSSFGFVFLVLNALSSIGILLSTLVLRANARQILYPLLYFPLTVPVLLCAVQVMLNFLQHQIAIGDQFSSWLGMLLVFDLLYFGLGLIFYGDLLKSS